MAGPVKKQKCPDPGAPGWMASFADLMSLLLTFFILILSFSTTEIIQFKKVFGALQGAQGALMEDAGSTIIAQQETRPDIKSNVDNQAPLMQFLESMEDGYSEEIEQNNITIEKTQDGIKIKIASQTIFEAGEARIRTDAYSLLNKISRMIRVYGFSAVVEGHTDNIPISSSRYPSNWELSTDRAVNTVRYLAEVGGVDPRTLMPSGRGQYKPIAPNDTPENRAKNRRVELYLSMEHLSGEELLEKLDN